ncbi:THO complex subunit 4D isoform X3 [Vigna angularis]|uniref:THO complex subunit 4D isoform X3 n=1 Tax=Phaseolus angularis TaxID=3914 RepID=UPI0022B34C2B|nr:THO complex subunit 4D isoform X3 [Vigna angularis]
MASSLDMSLDDRIKNRSNRGGRGRGGRGRAQSGRGLSGSLNGGRMAGAVNGRRMTGAGNGGRTSGAVRRGPLMVNTRPSSYAIAKSIRRTRPFPWQHDLFEDSLRAAGIQGVEVGTKLYVSNLDHGVTNEDIRELFSELGELKRYAVHYDKNGHPSGSAEVVYTRRSDAFAALKRYNNVLLDGKPMKIEIVGSNAELPVSARVNVTGVNGRRKRTVVMTVVVFGCRFDRQPRRILLPLFLRMCLVYYFHVSHEMRILEPASVLPKIFQRPKILFYGSTTKINPWFQWQKEIATS